jgi:hypothetical protein
MDVRHPSTRRSRDDSSSDLGEHVTGEQVGEPVGSGPEGPRPAAALLVEDLTKRAWMIGAGSALEPLDSSC